MKIYIITGEKSGDQHASQIVYELKKQFNDIEVRAWGGNALKSYNVKLDKHIKEINFMGFWNVIKNAFQILNNLKQCKQNILDFSPDLILLVDYPGFNLNIAEFASKNNFKIFYYISPKIWAWNSNRIKKIKKYIDKMFIIFPFEKKYYLDRGVDVDYFGNPVLEYISKNKFNKIKSEKPIISLLPGSRKQEIKRVLPIMLEVTRLYPNYNFIISATSTLTIDYYQKYIKGYNVDILFDKQYDLLYSSKASIITSGTSTLEAALMNVPQIVCYKTSFFSYLIAKYLVKIKYISLVNILLEKNVVAELIQKNLTFFNIKENLDKILDEEIREKMFKNYDELQIILQREKSVSEEIASEILKFNYS